MTTQERVTQRRLAKKEQFKDQHGLRGVGVDGKGMEVNGSTRVLFTCDMLLADERKRDGFTRSFECSGLTCAEPDDFQSLKERRWSTATEFKADEPVVLWKKEEPSPPHRQFGYVRSGRVVKVVLVETLSTIPR